MNWWTGKSQGVVVSLLPLATQWSRLLCEWYSAYYSCEAERAAAHYYHARVFRTKKTIIV